MQVAGLREYNVVTNRYLENHDMKETTNDDIQRAEAAMAFWKTHNYDHITGKYYDNVKEKEFVEKREEMAKTHGKDQVKKLPLTVQK